MYIPEKKKEGYCSRCKTNKSNGRIILMAGKILDPDDEYCDECAYEIKAILLYGERFASEQIKDRGEWKRLRSDRKLREQWRSG